MYQNAITDHKHTVTGETVWHLEVNIFLDNFKLCFNWYIIWIRIWQIALLSITSGLGWKAMIQYILQTRCTLMHISFKYNGRTIFFKCTWTLFCLQNYANGRQCSRKIFYMDQHGPQEHISNRVKYSFETFIEYPQSSQNLWFMHK